jgi:hypothetical protein
LTGTDIELPANPAHNGRAGCLISRTGKIRSKEKMMRLILSLCVGVALALHATTAHSENAKGSPAPAPATVAGTVTAPPVNTAMPGEATVAPVIRRFSAPRCVLPAMGYEYLYDPYQACTVSGYARMFQF